MSSVSFADVAHEYEPLNGRFMLKPGNLQTTLSIVHTVREAGCLLISPEGKSPVALFGNCEQLAATLRSLADRLDPPPLATMATRRAVPARPCVTTMTPQDVIDYFRASPVLYPLAPDVEHVLSPLVEPVSDIALVEAAIDDPSDLLGDTGPSWGAQSRVAEILGITTGGSHRKRILAVLRELKNKYSTSARKTALTGKKVA